MKKILIWVAFVPVFGFSQRFDGNFKFMVTATYDKKTERFLDRDTVYSPVIVKKEFGSFLINNQLYEISPGASVDIDSFYLDGDEKTYDILYTCKQAGHDKYIIINTVSSNLFMYYITITKFINGEAIRNEYTNFEL